MNCLIESDVQFAADEGQAGKSRTQEQHRRATVRNGVEREAGGVGSDAVSGRVRDLERASEGRGVIASLGDRAGQNHVEEQAVLRVNAGGGQVKGETTNSPETSDSTGVEGPRRNEVDRGAVSNRNEGSGGSIHDVVNPSNSLASRLNAASVELNRTAEADVTADRNGLGGLGENHGGNRQGDDCEFVFHIVLVVLLELRPTCLTPFSKANATI